MATPRASAALTTTEVIKIPYERGMKGDVYVEVNGKSYLIKRGENVTVPVAVANVLKRSEKMQRIAADFEEAAAEGLAALES